MTGFQSYLRRGKSLSITQSHSWARKENCHECVFQKGEQSGSKPFGFAVVGEIEAGKGILWRSKTQDNLRTVIIFDVNTGLGRWGRFKSSIRGRGLFSPAVDGRMQPVYTTPTQSSGQTLTLGKLIG